ncbi:MAG TPA: hypothetical protein VFK02_11130 [Kofleriaceae bacterium]|nr:hypothetical protein [Kofleriaceae bacterium]
MLITELGLAADVGRHLDSLRVRWLVGGSVASSILGIPRATVDIDLVADLRGAHVTSLYEAMHNDYYVDRDTMRWAVSTRRSFNAIHHASMIKVDLFCAGDDPLSRGELDRRVFFDLAVGRIPVCSSEDIVLQKLVWWRDAGGSERQWRDAVGVVQVRGSELDRSYIDLHAAGLGLTQDVTRLFDEAAQVLE